ncbi:MAG TPA: septal ring lytic transglycosylase RlpA family protein [Chitinispirillaceae bacterium]|nr:septal ring lytic transglycosylase RlpA family protein [Chitinispirillaceae bacterium]
MRPVILSLLILITILFLFQCAGSPRYTRAAPQKTSTQKKSPHKPVASSSKNPKSFPAKPAQAKNQHRPYPKGSTAATVPKKKEVEIRTASAPEMRFPSGPALTQSDEEIRGTLNSSDYRVYQKGKASYYADKLHGRKTASGERYNKKDLTAAHRKLPFNTQVKVTNTQTRQSVVVRINDRGPFVKGRIIDISRAAAEKIGVIKSGIADVVVEILE